MNRRGFIQSFMGAVAMAMVPLPASVEPEYTYKTYSLAVVKTEGTSVVYDQIGEQMARALARSMMRTKEQVAARVFLGDAGELEVQPITWEEMYIDRE